MGLFMSLVTVVMMFAIISIVLWVILIVQNKITHSLQIAGRNGLANVVGFALCCLGLIAALVIPPAFLVILEQLVK